MITAVDLCAAVQSGVDAEKAIEDGLPVQAYRFIYKDDFEHVAVIGGKPMRISQGAFYSLRSEVAEGGRTGAERLGLTPAVAAMKWATDRRFV